MKRLFITTVAIVAAMSLFVSCGGFMGVKITDQESVDAYLRQNIEKGLGGDFAITNIRLSAISDFTETMDIAIVDYFPEGSDELKSVTISMGGKVDAREGKVFGMRDKLTRADATKLSEIDFSKMASYIRAADAILIEGSSELIEEKYQLSGIAHYEISPNPDPEKFSHKFTIESKAGTSTTTKGGRLATETSYYEFNFEVDAQGNIEWTDL